MYYVCNRSAAIYKGLVLCKTIPVDFHERISKSTRKNKTTDAYLINSCCLCRTEISFSSYNVLRGSRFIYDLACLNGISYECHLNWVRFEFNPLKKLLTCFMYL